MRKTLSILCITIFLAILSVGCSKRNNNGGTDPAPLTRLYEYVINPSVTNSAITSFDSPHYVYIDTRVAPKNRLFVFLPGTSGFPSVYTLIVKKAAALGYHSIGLMYPNGSEIYAASGANPDNTSFGRCRQEVFDGSDQTMAITVNPDNSIRGRLTKLLQHLNATYPTQNWGQYLVNGQVDWSKCILAGHSQGGGHAVYISKKVSLHKALCFASIDWNSFLGASAAWIFEPGVTPGSKIYSFISPNDQVFSYVNVQRQLNDLGIPGVPVNIDNTNPPFTNSNRLITSSTAAITLLFPDHNITCLDQYVPKTAQGAVAPAFDSAWTYLINN
jgi:hypothetical protein